MEQQQEARNLIISFLLIIASVHFVSSQNLYTFTTTIDIGSTGIDQVTDYVQLRPSNSTSIYQDSTTYLPVSTSIQAEEILDSSETYVRNRYAQPFYQHNESTGEDDDPEEPPDHAIPYSEHEEARDVPTKPKYVGPGVWAKPPPERNIPLDFVPTKLHAQVRGTHTVKRLPQRQAIESAETDEERRNAPRLRAVVTNSKVNTVYSEEGYEDSAYDHAGHVRDADFHEGFARKLHDRKKKGQNSSSGNKKKGQHKNLMPDEFKEYEEDYQDHLEEDRKLTEASDDEDNLIGYGRNIWDGSELDPKLVAENGIQELEEDIEKNAEETEKNSKIYQNTQESELRNDIKTIDSSESKKSHSEDDLEDEENKPAKTKEKKSKLQYGKADTVLKGTKKSRKLEQKKKLRHENYETTVFPPDKTSSTDVETPTSSRGFATNPSSSQVYSIDQTTLRYVAPVTTAFRQFDEPRTISYSQMFWDFFKARQGPSTTESFTLVPNSTTMNPQTEERTPIAVATIDGHGPYLLITKEETTTSPSIFLGTHSFHPRNLFSDRVGFDPSSPQGGYNRHLLGQSDDVGYVGSMIAASTVATFTSVQPLLPESLPSLSPEDAEHSSSTILPNSTVSSSTPIIMTLNITQEAFSRIVDYQENPFLGPILDNVNIAVTKNKTKYKVLARPKPSLEKKSIKPVTQQSPHQQVSPSSTKEQDEYKKIRDELNAKYNKMLNYMINKKKIQSLPEKKKVAFPDDITLMRPPIRQRVAYSIFPTDRPTAVDHPSVSVESESPREANWKSLLQDQHRSQPIKLPLRSAYVQPVRLVYRKNQFPATKLLPPPVQLASSYANYYSNKQSDNYLPYIGGKQQGNNGFRYFPLIPEDSWRTRSRRKRSDEGEFRDGDRNGAAVDVKAAANNGVTNDNKSEQRDKDTMGLASPARSRDGESGTSATLVDKNINGESENVREDARKTVIDNPKLAKKVSISIPSAKQDGQINHINVKKLVKHKRNVSQNGTRSEKNLKNKRDHEELLDESPKISGDVIDKEIDERFNEKDNKTSAKIKEGRKTEIEIPSFDYVEELAEDRLLIPSITTEAAIDLKKYPFYNNNDLPSASALKYVVDPKIIPRKTSRGMEFYNSRNAYKQCDEVEPNLEGVLPEKEEPNPERGPQEDLPRLRGLGDKLDCFKAKYFDENPLDSPLFAEKLVEDPTPPSELNPVKFASKIVVLPEENDDYVVHRVSKKPERNGRQWWNRNRPYETHESIRVNYKHDPQTGRGRNAYLHTVRGSRPSSAVRRVKNRRTKPRIPSTTVQSPKQHQTAFYQNQVYEDVMGNIRNMANSYQVYEMTTLPPSTQILATAGSENILKVTEVTPIPPKEKNTSMPNVTDVTNSTKSFEIKGLVPPPKYSAPRQTSYRIHRPPPKSRVSLLRSPNFSRIIAHHHAIKINKRSTTNDIAKNSSESTINEDEENKVKESAKVDAIGNNTVVKSAEETTKKPNSTSELSDLKIEESKQVSTQDRNSSASLKVDNKKKRRNFTDSDQKNEPSQKTVYTIRDRVKYSKPKWNTRGFGKFNTSPKTVDEDSRRKEPRYNHVKRKKKLVGDRQNNSTIMNSTENTLGIESATSSIEGKDSSTTEVYHAEESVVHQTIYRRKDEYPEPEKAESVDTESEENLFEEEEEEEEEESTTNTYRVHEDVNENVSTTTPRPTNSQNSKEVQKLRDYLESDPPGYAETFPEDATTPSSRHHTKMNHESEDLEEKQDEETDYPKNAASPWDENSSEKAEEQVETPMKTNSPDDESEELSSKEKKTNKDQTFFTYKKRPSLIESNKDDESSEKSVYKPFPFSRYKSKFKKESEEDSEEEKEEGSEDLVFPWHADKEDKEETHKWLQKFNRYEYPWERRERQAKERRKKRKRANRLRQLFFDDEDEEESTRNEKPIYPWEKYNVPSKPHANIRRDISRKYIEDSEESNIEQLPVTKFSSRYSSRDIKPSKPSTAREISRSIKKFLEKDGDDESKEEASKEIEDRSPSFARKSSPSERGISRGTLVPEDITQPPRRKNARRNPQINKSVSSDSRFDSKKLRSKEITDEVEEEELAREYPQLNESNLNDSVSRTETSSEQSQLYNSTKEISSVTEPRKKRRRKISKNNSTIPLDSAPAESITEPTKKRRRRPQISTTTPSAKVDFDTVKSIYTPIRRIYPKTDETVTNISDSSEKTTVPKTIATENLQAETSTPKTRTIEHRSRVSKEKIVTKTTYPDEAENFDSRKMNVTIARKDPVRNIKTKLRRRKNNNKRNDNNGNSNDKLIEQKNEKEDYDVKFKGSKSEHNPLKSFGMKKEEVEKINGFSAYDGIINDENINNGDSRMLSETYAISNLIQNIPPNRVRNRTDGKTKSESSRISKDRKKQNSNKRADEEEKEKDAEEKRKLLLQTKFIKDPERRLYYYIEHK